MGSRKIKAPVERCYEIATDIESMRERHPGVRSVEVLERDNAGRASAVDLTADLAGIDNMLWKLSFSYEPPVRLSWQGKIRWDEGDASPVHGHWEFQNIGRGRTKATFEHDCVHPGITRMMAFGSFI